MEKKSIFNKIKGKSTIKEREREVMTLKILNRNLGNRMC